ncbi:MAG TPA: ParB/RepB/Spo0J family partition protein, partial [Candidatus Cybelea sp.]|nr:ParB/RepB/Spo0J family partition protein [Candidatus Cybelea sp.]
MTTTTVALSALLPPKNNPRRAYDRKSIEGLAQTIAKDGLIHNLTVCPEKGGKYRIIAGMRRFLALQHLTENGTISRTYKVPVRIEKKGSSGDLDRVAMVENVQREALDPIDEAEAFAKLLQGGAKVEDIAAETGVSVPTIRRRLALADLCEEVKKGVRDRKVTLSVAEVLTLATPAQQKNVVRQVRKHGAIDAAYLRSELLAQKPSVADAIFPLEWYAGTLTKDLFADKETTYFDDGEQFLSLQAKAVEALAEEHRKSAAWVEMVTEPVVHWWRYREAKRKEPKGVVIHLHPSGKVEVRQNLVQQEIDKEVVAPTKSRKPVEKPEWTKATIRYVNAHTVVAVQAALLRDRRVAKTVVAFLLLTARQASSMIGLKPH